MNVIYPLVALIFGVMLGVYTSNQTSKDDSKEFATREDFELSHQRIMEELEAIRISKQGD